MPIFFSVREAGFIKLVQNIDDRRTVGASASHTREYGNMFFHRYFNASVIMRDSGRFKKSLGRFKNEVVLFLYIAAVNGNAAFFRSFDRYNVAKRNGVHYRAKLMISVLPLSETVQGKVKLCEGF